MAEEQKPKRQIQRSPGYPAFGLGEAISKAEGIYKRERRNPTTPQVLMGHMGYGKKSGSGLRALAALKQFGLLEERNGLHRISDLAVQIMHSPDGSQERLGAVQEAASKPQLFRELLVTYGEGLPSDPTLESFLIDKKGFNPASVRDFIRVFRGTIELAKLTPGEYDGERAGGGAKEKLDTPPAQGGLGGMIVPPGEQVFSWPLSLLRNTRIEVKIIGRDFREEDLKHLDAQFDVLKANLKEMARAREENTGETTKGAE